MKYRLTYKRFSDSVKQFLLVDQEVEAARCFVHESGVLELQDKIGNISKLVPPGLWVLLEPSDAEITPAIIPPIVGKAGIIVPLLLACVLWATSAFAQDPMNRDYVQQQLAAQYASWCITPGPRGSGAADIEYYTDNVLATGGWSSNTSRGENNSGYWTDRIRRDGNYHSCSIVVPSPPLALDLALSRITALEHDVTAASATLQQLTRQMQDVMDQFVTTQQRFTDLDQKVAEANSRFGTIVFPKQPTGCSVQFLRCRLNY